MALNAWRSAVDVAELAPLPRISNSLWRVVAKNARVFVLKRLPEFAPGVGPVEEFRVLCYLQAAGIPVALPVLTDDGAIHTKVGDRFYALLPFVPSDAGNHELGPDATATSYAIGAAIGRLDRALADCPWQVRSFVDDPAQQILGEALPKLSAEVTRPVAPLVERLRAAASDLSVQRTHGDCNTGNVLVHRGRVAAFIDLDHLPLGPRVRDLSYYLASRLRTHVCQADTAERDTSAMLAVLGDYVAGYHEAYPLTKQELAAVVPLMLLVEIGGASWCLHGWVTNPDGYQQHVRTIAWITEHVDELTSTAGTPAMP